MFVPPASPSDVVGAPGANRSVTESLFEKQVTWSAAVVTSVQPCAVTGPTSESYTAPRLTVFATQAGASMSIPEASFPVEAKVVTPRALRLLIEAANALVNDRALSQSPANRTEVPRLMLMIATSGRLAFTQSRPATTSLEQQNAPALSTTLT